VSPNEYKHLVTNKLLRYWNDTIKNGQILAFSDIEDMRDEDTKNLLRAQNINSILLCPLFIGDFYYGFIGFDSCSKRHEWPKQDVAFLLSISRIIASAIERKQAEDILIINETKYRTMLNASPDGIFLVSLKGIITEASEIGLELMEADNKAELIGQHFFRMVPPEEKNLVKSIISRTLIEGLAQNIEIKIRKKSNKLFLSETSITLIQNTDREPLSYLITLRDISHRKKLEQQQINADRLASLGEMATGIAHEINQPLNIISLALDNLVFEAGNNEFINKEFLTKKASRIFENIDRMKNIIDHVRSFSRNQNDFILSEFDINESIKNALSMISEQLRHNGINLKLNLAKTLPQIVGNTFKFEQVILNLLSNAKDTLLEKSEILQNNYEMSILINSYIDSGLLVVEVSDNGMGISRDDAKLVMLPFYSTKDPGRGTGLGLSISHQIIKEMNGNFELETEINQGTTFKIFFNINRKIN
jgi:histidine kinase